MIYFGRFFTTMQVSVLPCRLWRQGRQVGGCSGPFLTRVPHRESWFVYTNISKFDLEIYMFLLLILCKRSTKDQLIFFLSFYYYTVYNCSTVVTEIMQFFLFSNTVSVWTCSVIVRYDTCYFKFSVPRHIPTHRTIFKVANLRYNYDVKM